METYESFEETNLSESIASLEDSPVRTSVLPDTAQASLESGAVYGFNSQGSFANWDQDSCSWKTSQLYLIEEWEMSSELFPASGTMRSGQLFLRAPWAQHTCDEDCSLWPTPTASMDGRGFGISHNENNGRFRKSIVLRVLALTKKHGWRIHPNFTEALMAFPQEWTAIEESETPSIQTLPNGSAAE